MNAKKYARRRSLKPTLAVLLMAALCQATALAAEPDAATPPSLNLDHILQDVKRDTRTIDRESPKTPPEKKEAALENENLQTRKTLEGALATARPKWNEPAIIEVIPNGSTEADGPILYKITTHWGYYCVLDKRDGSKRQPFPCTTLNF